jgi:hypothetical protein
LESIKIADFLERVHKRLKEKDSLDSDALIFFEIFLQKHIIEKINELGIALPNWQELELTAGDYDGVYNVAAEILHDAASRNFSEHSDTYKTAHAVSEVICNELNEIFEFKGEEVYELIPIKSFLEMAVEAGVIKIEDGMVELTPEGEEEAESIERQIKGSQN